MAMPTNWAKLTMVCSSPQKDHFYNVFYFEPTGAPTFTSNPMADANQLMADIGPTLQLHVPDILSTSCAVEGFNTELHVGGLVYDVSGVNHTAGTVAGDELADFEAVVIQKRTAVAGKSGRGRWYLGPIAEVLTNENYVEGASLSLFTNIATDWLSQPLSLGVNWKPMLFSKKNNSLTEITSTFVDPRLGSIGGRKRHTVL